MALASTDDLAAWLGVEFDAAEDVRAGRLLDLASGLVRRAARQTFELVVGDVALLAGSWRHTLTLPEQPVVAVNTVTVEGTAVTGWTLLSHGRVRLDAFPSTRSSWGDQQITVDYDHGWQIVPEDVQSIVVASASRQWTNPGNVTYESIDDYRVGFTSGGPNSALTRFEMELLKTYRPRP